MMRVNAWLWTGLLLLAPLAAASQTPPPSQPQPQPPEGPRLVVAYVEVAPSAEAQAIALLRRYRDGTRRDDGIVRADVLQHSSRRGHFIVIEEWRDDAARKTHRGLPQVAEFHDKLAPLRVSPYDERVHTGLAVAAAAAPPGGAVVVVTHVDVIPAGVAKARDMLSSLAAASRKENGNVRFDALQGVRQNHYTVVEAWRDEPSREAHLAQAHTKAFRDDLQQLSIDGGLYDERLFRVLTP